MSQQSAATILDEARAIVVELLGGETLPDLDCFWLWDLTHGDRAKLLVTCSAEIIVHVIARMAGYERAVVQEGWQALSDDVQRRIDRLCEKPPGPGATDWLRERAEEKLKREHDECARDLAAHKAKRGKTE